MQLSMHTPLAVMPLEKCNIIAEDHTGRCGQPSVAWFVLNTGMLSQCCAEHYNEFVELRRDRIKEISYEEAVIYQIMHS